MHGQSVPRRKPCRWEEAGCFTVHCHAGGQFVRAIASSAKGVPEMSCPGCDVL